MEICKKIDIHAHAIPTTEFEFPGSIMVTPDVLFELYDRIGVEKGILLPIISPEAMGLVMTNGNTRAMVERYPDRFFWFCNVDPRMLSNTPDSKLSDMLMYFKGLGAKGVGELTANIYADDALTDHLFGCCAECDMPVTIHIAPEKGGCYGIIDEIGLPRIKSMLKKHPNVRILGHSQPFWAEISADISPENRNSYPLGPVKEGNLAVMLREFENLYMDMSAYSCFNAMTRDTDYTYRFIEEFSDRMMYAVDYCNPSNRHTELMARFLDESAANGCISEDRYRAICRGNAIRILKLEEQTV